MAKQNDTLKADQPGKQSESIHNDESKANSKKLFVEPEISVPIDVLEATTFFQVATSGTTN